ncbi:MAG: type II toxin-antitoxin system VapC family toxin [Armatimonadetes bacterium]|nr:type II toxin-antitoxin system VapC family toxin [Armatimonadota bacterium]
MAGWRSDGGGRVCRADPHRCRRSTESKSKHLARRERLRLAFDTSVLIASLVEDHAEHAVCFPWYRTVVDGGDEGWISTHALAEFYATMSVLPLRRKLTPADTLLLVNESVLNRFSVMDLDVNDYHRALALVVRRGLRSGGIFDALTETAARKADARQLITLNTRDFARLCDDADTWLIDPRKKNPGQFERS